MRSRWRTTLILGGGRAVNPSTCESIEHWLQSLGALVQQGRIPCPGFLKPCDLVTLSLTLKRNNTVSLNLSERIAGYAARMGVWEAVGLECPTPVNRRHPGDRFCEITPLTDRNKVGEVASRLADIATSNHAAPSSDDTRESLYIILSEIAENCHAHAETGVGLHGLACAQTWYRGGRAQIAIADLGIGIRNSLEGDPSSCMMLPGRNAVDLATEYGVSSKIGKGHSGYGLALARGLAERSPESFLYLHSHGEVFCVDRGDVVNPYRCPPHTAFQGTLVVFEWAISGTLDVGEIYRSWPNSEDDDDDYF